MVSAVYKRLYFVSNASDVPVYMVARRLETITYRGECCLRFDDYKNILTKGIYILKGAYLFGGRLSFLPWNLY